MKIVFLHAPGNTQFRRCEVRQRLHADFEGLTLITGEASLPSLSRWFRS
jgi:hypothetical protein